MLMDIDPPSPIPDKEMITVVRGVYKVPHAMKCL